MIDVGSLSGGLASLKAAKDIAESLINLRDTAKFQAAVVELQGKILAAQTEQFAMLERVRGFEEKMAALDAWTAERSRYELVDFGGNTFAYALKDCAANGEPPHRICPACYQQREKSILQFDYRTSNNQDRYKCPNCKTDFDFGARQRVSSSTGRRRNPFAI